jgi:HlyD family secretion protein
MDREIEFQQLNSRRRRNWGKWMGLFLLFLGLIWLLRAVLTPQASIRDFRVANVERGVLENTIAATGLVTPSFEQQINAPIATEIKRVALRSGTQVHPGDLIMELDKTFILLEVAGRKSKLDLSRNAIDLLKLELERDLKELEYDDQIKSLEVASAKAALADADRLVKVGGATAEEAEQAQTRLRILELEKSKLENELNYRRQSLAGRQREVVLAANVEEQQVRELESKLDLTEVRATSRGVITWVNENIGEQVPEGSPLVRIADLRNFQIEGACSDRFADRIQVGQEVNVRINDNFLKGHIKNILPAVSNNTVAFIVDLESPDDPQLRPNMRVETFVVTDRKKDVLRVKQGAAFKGGQRQDIYVIRGNEAHQLDVRTGISNGEYIELLTDQLKAGDRIIISDMSDYEHLDVIQLK